MCKADELKVILTYLPMLCVVGQCDLRLMFVPMFDDYQDMAVHVRTTVRYTYSFIQSAALQIGQDILEVDSFGGYALNGVDGALGPNGHSVPTVGGYPVYRRQPDLKTTVFNVVIGDNMNVTMRTFKDFVAVEVSGADEATFHAVTGLMGSFDGKMLARNGTDLENNINALGQDWQVQPDEEMMFRSVRSPQAPELCLLPQDIGPDKEARRLRRRLTEERIPRDQVEKGCAHLTGNIYVNCVNDVVASGDLDIAQIYY